MKRGNEEKVLGRELDMAVHEHGRVEALKRSQCRESPLPMNHSGDVSEAPPQWQPKSEAVGTPRRPEGQRQASLCPLQSPNLTQRVSTKYVPHCSGASLSLK